MKNDAHLLAENKEIPPESFIADWRLTLARNVIRAAALVSLPAVAAASYYAYDAGTYGYLPIYLAVLIILFAAAFWRKVPEDARIWIVFAVLYFTVVLDFYTEGRGSLGRVFVVALATLAAVFYGRRGALIAGGFGLLTMALFAYLFVGGFLPDYQVGSRALSGWLSNMTIVAVVAFMLAFSVEYISRNMTAYLERSRELNRALQAERAALEALAAERASALEEARAAAEEAQAALRAQLDEIQALSRVAEAVRGEQDLITLSQNALRELCLSLGAAMGAIYVRSGDLLSLAGGYAYTRRKNLSNRFRLGEGIVGQAALEKQPILIANPPPDYVSLETGMLELAPRSILAAPFLRDGETLGVVELAALGEFTVAQLGLVNKALESIAIAVGSAQARAQINALLEKTQLQTRELQAREEELTAINEELQAQTDNLRASQEHLRRQQSELEAANAELEERANALQQQRAILNQQNRELTQAQAELQRKAQELASANKYKSEFLANMSHELRTPLNSLLILARMLANNEEGNLTEAQVESAKIIFNSGTDLLNLINDILDLSKVEAGRMSFHFAPTPVQNLLQNMRALFNHLAEEKGLEFKVEVAAEAPPVVETDQQRVEQIIKNLLSNAFKFTEQGGVTLRVEREGEWLAFRVCDTGIGMTPEQQKVVFEAFQQADGSTSRKYGGTGLGLAISREMAAKLGGRIDLQSEPGVGSVFSLLLPVQRAAAPESAPAQPQAASAEGQTPAAPHPAFSPRVFLPDDRERLRESDTKLLIIEDDASFASLVMEYGRRKGFQCLAAESGEDGLNLARLHKPDAVLLDLNLPGMSGWETLDAFKRDPELRHIPVHILSASEETLDAYSRGALGFLTKPVTQEGLDEVFEKISEFLARDVHSLLIVEDDATLRAGVRQLLAGDDVEIIEAENGATALSQLRARQFDCMILDLNLPDMTGFDLLNRIHQDQTANQCPVVVYTGRELSEEENERLLKYADSVIIKGVKSPERLLDETALFLHRVVADMPEEKRAAIRRLHDPAAVFEDKRVLVVDDDMRNAFALSRLLKDKGLKVSLARNGVKALEALEDPANKFDLILMDIMMPEMDGYETMRRIRAQPRFKNLPILALTAKAMKGDLEKCLEAGANDYLSKPVDIEKLFSMLRVWLYR